MSNNQLENNTKKKFTLRDALLWYPWLKKNPENLRQFASTFLPIPGFPQPTSPNADDSVQVIYDREIMNATTGEVISLEPKTILLPLGAAAAAGAAELPNYYAEKNYNEFMRSLTFMVGTRFKNEILSVPEVACCGCGKKIEVGDFKSRFKFITSEGMLIGLTSIYYPMCRNNPLCNLKANQAIFDPKDPRQRYECAYCDKMENTPLQFKRCPRCKVTFYCSKECQAKDWKEHKKFCNKDKKTKDEEDKKKKMEETTIAVCGKCGKAEEENSKSPFMKCGGCHTTLYCSKKCQSEDWKVHKKTCCIPPEKKVKKKKKKKKNNSK